jgi:hypothetical protein
MSKSYFCGREEGGGEGRRLRVSCAKLIQQHKHCDHEEYQWYTGNMNIIDVLKTIIVMIIIITVIIIMIMVIIIIIMLLRLLL